MTPPPKRSGTAGLRPRCCEDLKRRVSEACGVTEGGPKEALGALRTAGGQVGPANLEGGAPVAYSSSVSPEGGSPETRPSSTVG